MTLRFGAVRTPRAAFWRWTFLAWAILAPAAAAGEPTPWALTSPARPPVPAVKGAVWARNPIDRFVLARLEKAGLRPNPEADRLRLLRRVCYDLTGLPPSPQDVAAFLADKSPDAYDRLVDRLLASPQFGERWAQHWLDVARYSETEGFKVDRPRENAWRYRDYVVAAFNADMPYDRFLRQQLAGDELDSSGYSRR